MGQKISFYILHIVCLFLDALRIHVFSFLSTERTQYYIARTYIFSVSHDVCGLNYTHYPTTRLHVVSYFADWGAEASDLFDVAAKLHSLGWMSNQIFGLVLVVMELWFHIIGQFCK